MDYSPYFSEPCVYNEPTPYFVSPSIHRNSQGRRNNDLVWWCSFCGSSNNDLDASVCERCNGPRYRRNDRQNASVWQVPQQAVRIEYTEYDNTFGYKVKELQDRINALKIKIFDALFGWLTKF